MTPEEAAKEPSARIEGFVPDEFFLNQAESFVAGDISGEAAIASLHEHARRLDQLISERNSNGPIPCPSSP